ncbi:uncharacterized protein KY384_002307 [Bacidia gigantensis]|uniref:uncharacterized protein n=1 Tax=Bacidia gigantensis TaxID=2732470 RepID=UPI001D054FAA|nr:uncharacterized protein KY384_002307 [Bacidia gigantensis]KAG8533521.1 hypothetical protein KY384_002307 [Bacidia gigantensis]
MVYVATLTSILILLLGPFAQQAVNIVNRQTVVANDTADIPFVEHWAGPLHQSILKTDAGVEGVGIPYASTDPGVNNNVLRGILGPDASHSDVKPVCLGANCTIPSYTTLGICSSTEDFKSHIIVQKGDGSNGETNYTIDELVAHPPLRGRPFDTSRVHVGMSAYPDSRSKAQQIWSRPYTNPDPKVLSEFYVMYPYKSYTEAPKDLLASVGASKVTLEYCLYTLQTEVRNGQTNTTVIDVIIEDLDWQWRGSSSNRSAFTTHTIGSNTTEYSASEAMKDALNTYMASEILYGSWLMTSGFDAAESDVALAIGKSLYHNNSGELTFDGWEGIDRLTDNLAISITNAHHPLTNSSMRTTADYSNLAVGTVSYTEIFIKVNFFWLILPIAAVLWVLMFLVIVIIQSKRAGIPAWKTSQLQAMQVLEPGVRDGLRLDKDEGAKMRVRLVTGEEGWLLGKNTDERSDEGVEMDLLGQ